MMLRIYEGSIYALIFVIVGIAYYELLVSTERLLTLAAYL